MRANEVNPRHAATNLLGYGSTGIGVLNLVVIRARFGTVISVRVLQYCCGI
jgi:hypothetical protein